MNYALIVLLAAVVSFGIMACQEIETQPKWYPCTYRDPIEVQSLFLNCLKNSGNSQNVKYNDSAEVIEECRYAARALANEQQGFSRDQYGSSCRPLTELFESNNDNTQMGNPDTKKRAD